MRRGLLVLSILSFLSIPTTGCIGRLVTAGGETELGSELSEKVERQLGLVENEALQSYVQEVGFRLATASPKVRDSLTYHCRVIDMAPPNAFALPGGFIYVSRGILPLLNSEDELANVLAHEIAHVSERHHLQHALRSTPFVPVNLATGIGAFAVGLVSPLLGRAVSAVGSAPSGLVLASYSRGQEMEADEVGQEVAASAGWDPAAMSQVMESLTLDEQRRGGDPERRSYFATHPTNPDRARKTAQRAEAFAISDANPIASGKRDFLSHLDGLLIGESARNGVITGNEFLHPGFDFRIAFPRDWKIGDDGRVVRAIAENQDAIALITIVGEGSDADEVARRVIDKTSIEVEQGPANVRIGQFDAVRAVAGHARGGERFRYVLTWLAHGGHVYQISAGAYAQTFDARGPALDAVAKSFRPLEAGDWPRIREGRLRIVEARGGESLSDLLPAASAWSLEETAVANRLAPNAVLETGALLKVAPLERYVHEETSAE